LPGKKTGDPAFLQFLRRSNTLKTLIKSLIVMALAAKLFMPGVASAYLTGGTWIETGAETGYAPFTKIEVFADASTTLTDVVLYGLTAPGWTNTLVNPRYVVAQGPPPGYVLFTWQFPDPGDQYREIEYLVWNGNTLNSQQHLIFNQSGWYVPIGTGSYGYYPGDGVTDFYDNSLPSTSHAPLPTTVLLLGTGLLALIGLRRAGTGHHGKESR
jgi:hypothetical protein